ncbi:39S ribosomal protein S18a, mitochondrial [Cephus cinctus]|uniref:Large ribosomal subunit protein mL66 n=1 Tax=Cephus cinctus TaxID=211228 RepID=A0AAJ7RAR3_CEPCN|nr:39S ribosomal protein S18a, mitochondrial [Cephus cinctus]
MAALCRLTVQASKAIFFPQSSRNVSLSAVSRLKEIREKKEGNTLIISGEFVKPKDEHLQIKNNTTACPLCATGLDVKHTDVLILSQFLRSDGCMLPRRITNLCKVQQKRVSVMVAMAQKAGLMPNLNPPSSKKDPKRRYGYKKYNTYFDEATIQWKL